MYARADYIKGLIATDLDITVSRNSLRLVSYDIQRIISLYYGTIISRNRQGNIVINYHITFAFDINRRTTTDI